MIDQIIRSKRRTLGLQITPKAEVIVRAPHRASMDAIMEWVNKNLGWIQKHQMRLRAQIEQRPAPHFYVPLETLHSVISERAQSVAKNAGLTYTSLRISKARTRWASCSRRGRLNFSWRLAMTPLWVIDYVIAHELAHLVHLNHSKRFWSKVAELFPNYKEARRWLRTNQTRLGI